MLSFRVVLSGIALIAMSLANLVLLYFLLASPPIHLFYDIAPAAGPSSVYVPGSGFSGFWFHLGALQAIPSLHDYDFYCYSSGCLSVVLAAMNVSVSDALGLSYGIQQAWLAGNMTRFEMVDTFLEGTLGNEASPEYAERIESFLPNLNVLVTSKGKGVEVVQPLTRQELVTALKRTTWIPFVTGEGVLRPDNANGTCPVDEAQDEFYLDGGFSRVLHPECEHGLWVPNTWINMLYTLNPALSPAQVETMWDAGRNFDHPLLAARLEIGSMCNNYLIERFTDIRKLASNLTISRLQVRRFCLIG